MEVNELRRKERKDKGPKEKEGEWLGWIVGGMVMVEWRRRRKKERREKKAKEEKERRRKRGELCSENLAFEFSKKRKNSTGEIGEWIDFIVSSSSCFEFQVFVEIMLLLDEFFIDLELVR